MTSIPIRYPVGHPMDLCHARKNSPTNVILPAPPGRSRLQTPSQGKVYHYQSHPPMRTYNRQLIPKGNI